MLLLRHWILVKMVRRPKYYVNMYIFTPFNVFIQTINKYKQLTNQYNLFILTQFIYNNII